MIILVMAIFIVYILNDGVNKSEVVMASATFVS